MKPEMLPERIYAAPPDDEILAGLGVLAVHRKPPAFGGQAIEYVRADLHAAEVERLRAVAALWLDRIERDRGERDKVLAQARSLRAALAIGATENAAQRQEKKTEGDDR